VIASLRRPAPDSGPASGELDGRPAAAEGAVSASASRRD
jgi:hypothetical protein